jgi:hypothetical protein
MTPEEFVAEMRKVSRGQSGNFYESEALATVLKRMLKNVP